MKVLLINPNASPTITGVQPILTKYLLAEPLSLEIIAGAIPEHEIRILDMEIDPELESAAAEFRPDVVGVTCGYTMSVYIVRDILKRIKAMLPEAFTIVGGTHPTILPEDFCRPYVNAIAMGDGPSVMRDLMDCLERGGDLRDVPGLALHHQGRLHRTGPRQPVLNLDEWPAPRRDLVAAYRDRYFMLTGWKPLYMVMTQIGCTERCNFCSLWRLTRGIYLRSAESIVDELESIPSPYIYFTDPHFLIPPKRAAVMARLIKERGLQKKFIANVRTDTIMENPELVEQWAEIGLTYAGIGLESFRTHELEYLRKRNTVENNEAAIRILRRNKIHLLPSFIIRQDYTAEDFLALESYVKELGLSLPIFFVLTPFPGTDLFDQRRREILSENYELYDLFRSVLPTRMPREEFYRAYVSMYRRLYSWRRFGQMTMEFLVEKFRKKNGGPPLSLPSRALVMAAVQTVRFNHLLRNAFRLEYDMSKVD